MRRKKHGCRWGGGEGGWSSQLLERNGTLFAAKEKLEDIYIRKGINSVLGDRIVKKRETLISSSEKS